MLKTYLWITEFPSKGYLSDVTILDLDSSWLEDVILSFINLLIHNMNIIALFFFLAGKDLAMEEQIKHADSKLISFQNTASSYYKKYLND